MKVNVHLEININLNVHFEKKIFSLFVIIVNNSILIHSTNKCNFSQYINDTVK